MHDPRAEVARGVDRVAGRPPEREPDAEHQQADQQGGQARRDRRLVGDDGEDPGLKLACFSTAPAIRNPVANIITEVIGTFLLVFGVLAFFANADTAATGLGGLLVGLLVFGIGLSLGGPTGYAINPARDLGPRIMHAILPIAGKGDSDWGYSWIPVVGPIVGGVLGALAFDLFYPG